MDSAEYPAQRTVRASPPPQTALPVSHELPVDCCQSPLGFPVLRLVPLPACRRYYPGRTDGLVRSFSPIDFGLPRIIGGSAPALAVSGPAQRSLALRPADLPSRLSDPLHRRLQQLCYLHCCSDCYRVERTSSPGGTFTHCEPALFTA